VPHPKHRFPVPWFGHSAEARHLHSRFVIARGYAELKFTIHCVFQVPETKSEDGCESGVHNFVANGRIAICQDCGVGSLGGLFLHARLVIDDTAHGTDPCFISAEQDVPLPTHPEPQSGPRPSQGFNICLRTESHSSLRLLCRARDGPGSRVQRRQAEFCQYPVGIKPSRSRICLVVPNYSSRFPRLQE
jgi:hypothetical protein